MKDKHKNLIIVVITLSLYLINILFIRYDTDIKYLSTFFDCYFNDFIGSITFCAWVNYVYNRNKKKFNKLSHIILLMLFCGFVWEVITPIFRKNTVFDIYDFFMYELAGICYYLLSKLIYRRNVSVIRKKVSEWKRILKVWFVYLYLS